MGSGSERISIVRLAFPFPLSSRLIHGRIRSTTMTETLAQSSETLREQPDLFPAQQIPPDWTVAECRWVTS